jgi:predicted PurR-regulated permease PerM
MQPRKESVSLIVCARILSIVLLVACLKLGQTLLVPICLSILLSFLLAPAATLMERIGVPRYPTALIVVLGALCIVAAFGWLIVNESSTLLSDSPAMRRNVSRTYSGALESALDSLQTVEDALSFRRKEPRRLSANRETATAEENPAANGKESENPSPLEAGFSPFGVVSSVGLAAFEFIVSGLIIAVLSIFLLVHREDARDRILGLAGESRLVLASQVVYDVVNGVRRYLLLNLLVNVIFATAFALIMFLFGIPDPALWACVAVFSRFVPHIGVYLALIPPFILSLSMGGGWTFPLLLLASGAALDVIVSNFVEPQVYGRGIGVSSLAVVFSALFWTWCWGIPGLLLATPFTVVMAVLGRYVPGFEAFSVLFGDEFGLRPSYRLYHRLVSRQRAEAEAWLAEFTEEAPGVDVLNEIVIPAVYCIEKDQQQRLLSAANYEATLQTVASLSPELLHPADDEREISEGEPRSKLTIAAMGLPSERIVAELLRERFERRGYEVNVLSEKSLLSETISALNTEQVRALIVVTFIEYTGQSVRYLQKRLRSSHVHIPCIVFRIGPDSPAEPLQGTIPGLASAVVPSLEKAQIAVQAFAAAVQPQMTA